MTSVLLAAIILLIPMGNEAYTLKLTTKFRYGTRAMLDLGTHSSEKPVSLKEIAKRQDISPKYLETLFSILQTSGTVRSVRGAQGGYQLAVDPADITLKRIFELFEDTGWLVECTADPSFCDRAEDCVTREIWSELYDLCTNYLDSLNLKDLMDRVAEKAPTPDVYYI